MPFSSGFYHSSGRTMKRRSKERRALSLTHRRLLWWSDGSRRCLPLSLLTTLSLLSTHHLNLLSSLWSSPATPRLGVGGNGDCSGSCRRPSRPTLLHLRPLRESLSGNPELPWPALSWALFSIDLSRDLSGGIDLHLLPVKLMIVRLVRVSVRDSFALRCPKARPFLLPVGRPCCKVSRSVGRA